MNLVSLGIDLVAIVLLAFGIYFQRYRRREVMVAMIGLNVAVVAVSAALASKSCSSRSGDDRAIADALSVAGAGRAARE